MESRKVEVMGQLYPLQRALTGLWSLDRSLGFRKQNGIPLGGFMELYGPEHSGKSTLSWFLSAKVKPTGIIWIADLEGAIDKDYIQNVMEHAGFRGTVHVSDYTSTKKNKKVLVPHEKQVEQAIGALMEADVNAAIIDSIGAFTPIMERSKALGERTVGQRAKTMADLSRKLVQIFRERDEESPGLGIYVNHVHEPIGGFKRGQITPGGVVIKYLSDVRLSIRRRESSVPDGTGNFLARTKVEKLRAGGAHSGRKGLIYFIPGYGVSVEMTDVFDCVGVGVAKREASIQLLQYDDKKGKDVWVKMGSPDNNSFRTGRTVSACIVHSFFSFLS